MTNTDTQKRAGWKTALGIACGIGIAAAICVGIGLAFALPVALQIGFTVGAAAVTVALAGGYQHFLYDD